MPNDLDPTVRAQLYEADDGEHSREDVRAVLAALDAQAARLADIWLLVDLWDAGAEGSLETLERLVALKETGRVD